MTADGPSDAPPPPGRRPRRGLGCSSAATTRGRGRAAAGRGRGSSTGGTGLPLYTDSAARPEPWLRHSSTLADTRAGTTGTCTADRPDGCHSAYSLLTTSVVAGPASAAGSGLRIERVETRRSLHAAARMSSLPASEYM